MPTWPPALHRQFTLPTIFPAVPVAPIRYPLPSCPPPPKAAMYPLPPSFSPFPAATHHPIPAAPGVDPPGVPQRHTPAAPSANPHTPLPAQAGSPQKQQQQPPMSIGSPATIAAAAFLADLTPPPKLESRRTSVRQQPAHASPATPTAASAQHQSSNPPSPAAADSPRSPPSPRSGTPASTTLSQTSTTGAKGEDRCCSTPAGILHGCQKASSQPRLLKLLAAARRPTSRPVAAIGAKGQASAQGQEAHSTRQEASSGSSSNGGPSASSSGVSRRGSHTALRPTAHPPSNPTGHCRGGGCQDRPIGTQGQPILALSKCAGVFWPAPPAGS